MRAELEQVKELFLQAVELSPDQRDSFLDENCQGDVELRQSVERLLQGHASGVSLIDRVVADGNTKNGTTMADIEVQAIGPYQLREKLGEGGMGIVFAAEQKEPIRRKVALKIIKPGMDTREVIARFEVERRALAMMDHQNIARVLDAGTADTGRPYFVMELVRGLSVTEYCDKNKLSIRDRLQLFVQICRAVQHAHQKGIIHRDIKPSNVMVTLHDGVPVPKVIDFGVAKAIDQRLTVGSVYTKVSQMVGTPAYMSPEQAELSGLDIDTRTDIYSLGVLLYELLTGTTPFTKEQLSDANFDEMRRILRETDPPRPSERISTLNAEAISTVSRNRGYDHRKLTQTIRGELDWIVLKTLEKDRTRRYETANALAADVQRHLNNHPVVACPPSAIYLFRKFAGRNRGLLAAGLLLFTSLVVGAGVSTWQAARASIAEQRSNENFRLTLNSLKTAYSFAGHLDEEPELKPWHMQVLNDAFENCQRVIDRLEDQPEFTVNLMELLLISGQIHYRIDRLESAADSLSRAIEIGESADVELNESSRFALGSAYDQMAAVQQALGPSDGLAELIAANKIWLSETKASGADSAQVVKLAKNYLQMAMALRRNGDYTGGLSCFEQSLRVCDDWLKSHDGRDVVEVRVEALVELSNALTDVGDRDRATDLAQESYKLASTLGLRQETVAGSATVLAGLLSDSRETVEQAERLLVQARKIRAQLAADYPNHIPHLAKYSRSLIELSKFKRRLGKNEDSMKLQLAAVEIQEDLSNAQGDNINVLNQLASLLVARGNAALELEKRDAALQIISDELRLREELLSRRDDVVARINLAAALTRFSRCHLQAHGTELKKGEGLLRRADELLSTSSVVGLSHRFENVRGAIFLDLAHALFLQGRNVEAEKAMKRSIKFRKADSLHNAQKLKRMAGDLSNLALFAASQEKELVAAEQLCLKAIDLQEQAISLAISDVEKEGCVAFLSTHYFVLGDLCFLQFKYPEALAAIDRSVELNPNQGPSRTAWFAEMYIQEVPEEFRSARRAEKMARLAMEQDPDFHNAQVWLGVALFRQEKFEEAGQLLSKTIKKSPDDLNNQAYLGMTRYRLGEFEKANELLQKSYRHSIEASLCLIMAVVRSENEDPDAAVDKNNVAEFMEYVIAGSKDSTFEKGETDNLIAEAKAVLQELPRK